MNLLEALRSPDWCEEHGIPRPRTPDGGCDRDCSGDCDHDPDTGEDEGGDEADPLPNGGAPAADDRDRTPTAFGSNAPPAPMPFVLETRRRVIRVEERQAIMLKVLVTGIGAILVAVAAGIIVQLFVAGTF